MTLKLDIAGKLNLTVQDIAANRSAVLGISGSGKTNTVALIVEALLNNNVPLTIVDIEGEYWGLKQGYEILIVGKSDKADIALDVNVAGGLAELSVSKGVSVILDFSEHDKSEMLAFLLAYSEALFEVCGKAKRPYQLVLEEAHEFIPQGQRSDLKEVISRIALRGRKRGLGVILSSQRSAKIEKDVLTQTELVFLHKVVHPVDLKIYKDLIPLPPHEVETKISQLQQGQAIVLYKHEPKLVTMAVRATYHASSTPSLENKKQPKLRKIDKSLLDELKGLSSKAKPKTSKSKIEGDGGEMMVRVVYEDLNSLQKHATNKSTGRRLDKAQRTLIIEMLAAYATQKEIAAEIGCSESNIVYYAKRYRQRILEARAAYDNKHINIGIASVGKRLNKVIKRLENIG